jgi:hypothetical protein
MFPGQSLGRTFINHLCDTPGGCSCHIHPGSSAGIEYFNQFPETSRGVYTLGWYPEDGDIAIGILPVSRISHLLSFDHCSALKNKLTV